MMSASGKRSGSGLEFLGPWKTNGMKLSGTPSRMSTAPSFSIHSSWPSPRSQTSITHSPLLVLSDLSVLSILSTRNLPASRSTTSTNTTAWPTRSTFQLMMSSVRQHETNGRFTASRHSTNQPAPNRQHLSHNQARIPHQIQTPQITIPNETLQLLPLSNRNHRCSSKHQVQILLQRPRRRSKERSPCLVCCVLLLRLRIQPRQILFSRRLHRILT